MPTVQRDTLNPDQVYVVYSVDGKEISISVPQYFTDENGIRWKCQWNGNYNVVYFANLTTDTTIIQPDNTTVTLPAGDYVLKRPLSELDSDYPKQSLGMDYPERSVRVCRKINEDLRVELHQHGWILPFISGTTPSCEEICIELVNIYEKTGRVVVDALSLGNFIKQSADGKIRCIDIGFAALLDFENGKYKSQDSVDWWQTIQERYKKFFNTYPASPVTQMVKALLYLSYYYPKIRDVETIFREEEMCEQLAKSYDAVVLDQIIVAYRDPISVTRPTEDEVNSIFAETDNTIFDLTGISFFTPEILQKANLKLTAAQITTMRNLFFTDTHYTLFVYLVEDKKSHTVDQAIKEIRSLTEKDAEQLIRLCKSKMSAHNAEQIKTFFFFFNQFENHPNYMDTAHRIAIDLDNILERHLQFIKKSFRRFEKSHKENFILVFNDCDHNRTVVATHMASALTRAEQFSALQNMPKQVKQNVYAIVGADDVVDDVHSGLIVRTQRLNELINFYNTHFKPFTKYAKYLSDSSQRNCTPTPRGRGGVTHASKFFQTQQTQQISLLDKVLLASGIKEEDQKFFVEDLFQAIKFLDGNGDLKTIKSLVAIIAMMFAVQIVGGVSMYCDIRDELISQVMKCADLSALNNVVKNYFGPTIALRQAFEKVTNEKELQSFMTSFNL